MNGHIDQLKQFLNGPIWDGHLISKDSRKQLVKVGMVHQYEGFNFLTLKGLRILYELGLLKA